MNEELRKQHFQILNSKANRLYRHWKITKDPGTLLRIQFMNRECFRLIEMGLKNLQESRR